MMPNNVVVNVPPLSLWLQIHILSMVHMYLPTESLVEFGKFWVEPMHHLVLCQMTSLYAEPLTTLALCSVIKPESSVGVKMGFEELLW